MKEKTKTNPPLRGGRKEKQMRVSIHAGENERTRIGKIVGEGIYVKVVGKEIPEDFIIYSTNMDGTMLAVRPVQDYQEARDLVRKLKMSEAKERNE